MRASHRPQALDDNGNLTSDGSRSYTWDARNQLTGISGSVSASFGYDAFGRRRSRTVGSATTAFLYDGLNPVQELVSGTASVNFLTGLGIDEFLTWTDGSGTSTYLTDALGSTVALADGSAAACSDYVSFLPIVRHTLPGIGGQVLSPEWGPPVYGS